MHRCVPFETTSNLFNFPFLPVSVTWASHTCFPVVQSVYKTACFASSCPDHRVFCALRGLSNLPAPCSLSCSQTCLHLSFASLSIEVTLLPPYLCVCFWVLCATHQWIFIKKKKTALAHYFSLRFIRGNFVAHKLPFSPTIWSLPRLLSELSLLSDKPTSCCAVTILQPLILTMSYSHTSTCPFPPFQCSYDIPN